MVVGSLTVDTDVVVIGGGPGGYVAAIRAAQLGKDVMLIEKDHVGGVCLNTGCIPTKAYVHASNYYSVLEHLQWMGVEVKDYSFDPAKMKNWKDTIVQKLRDGITGLCKKHGVEVIEGVASFVSETQLRIAGKSDVNTINFKQCIIATGSQSIQIPGFEFSDFVMDSERALALEHVPKKLVIIGGGYIGTEMGTIFAKLGSEVHIVEAAPRILSVIEEDVVAVMHKKLESLGVTIHVNAKAKSQTGHSVIIEENGQDVEIACDNVLVVVGRKPNTQNLEIDKSGVVPDEKGFIPVNEQMQTPKSHIYAIGDVVGQPMLAHKASREGKIAAEVICGKPSAFDNKVIPYVVFNDPEIAGAGLTKAQAQEKGHEVVVGSYPYKAVGRALTLNQEDGFLKVVADKKTGLVLGVHAIGPNVSEIIAEAAHAIEMGSTVEDLALTIHPHPTISESLMEASDAAFRQIYEVKK